MAEMELNLQCIRSQKEKNQIYPFFYCTLQMSIKAVFIKPVALPSIRNQRKEKVVLKFSHLITKHLGYKLV